MSLKDFYKFKKQFRGGHFACIKCKTCEYMTQKHISKLKEPLCNKCFKKLSKPKRKRLTNKEKNKIFSCLLNVDIKYSYGYVYKIINLINNKNYIGITKRTVHKRFLEHCISGNCYIDQEIKKYGINNFTIQIIDYADNSKDLKKLETFYIKELNTLKPKGYNLKY